MLRKALLLLGLALSAMPASLPAQAIELGETPRGAAAKGGHVLFVSDAVGVSAGKPQQVELRFRIDPGFHINSHKPADELLIPTALKFEPNARLAVLGMQFPAGSPFRLAAGGDLLDVYQGEVRVAVQLRAAQPGETTLSGVLRYQACDNAACFPPRNLPVRVAVTAR